MSESSEQKLIVAAVVLNKDGKVLLTQRFDPEFKGAHLKWELPGGKREIGESLEDTCRREVLEETGYRVKVINMIPYHFEYTWKSNSRTLDVVILGFRCGLLGGRPHLNDHKVNDSQWVVPLEIHNLELLVGSAEFIAAALKA
jgi:8-oxo-dGTP pyrophosphatase MutT (NUDIX family)